MPRRLIPLVLSLLTGLPATAQSSFTLPASPSLCADLAVSVRFAEGRDHRRAVFDVRNTGPGAAPAVRNAVVLATALTASGAPDQRQRFDVGGLAPGEARSFSVTRAGHDPFVAWGLIQFGSGVSDCNPANNSAVQAAN